MAFKRIKDWATSITSFRTGDVIPVDGPSGTAKMSKDDLLKMTAQNALAGNMAPAFDPAKPNDAGGYAYYKNEYVSYYGQTYVFVSDKQSGDWDSSYVTRVSLDESFVDFNAYEKLSQMSLSCAKISFVGKDVTAVKTKRFPIQKRIGYRIKLPAAKWAVSNLTTHNVFIFTLYDVDGVAHEVLKFNKSNISQVVDVWDFYPDDDICFGEITLRANAGESVVIGIETLTKSTDASLGSFEFTCKGSTQIYKDFPCQKNKSYYVVFDDTEWDDSVVSAGVRKFYLTQVNDDNTTRELSFALKGELVRRVIKISTNGYAKALRFGFRGRIGEQVSLKVVDSFYSVLEESDVKQALSFCYNKNNRLPAMSFITDPHNSNTGFESFLDSTEFVNAIGFFKHLQIFGCTGDLCSDHPSVANAFKNYKDYLYAKKCGFPILPAIGNHDVGSAYYIGNYIPKSSVVDEVIKPAVDAGYIPPNNGYYYIDDAENKIRYIVLCQFGNHYLYDSENLWERVAYDSEAPEIALNHSYSANDVVNIPGWTDYSYKATTSISTPASVPSTLSHSLPSWGVPKPDISIIDATQAQWYADTLLSVPQNYSVVVLLHTAFSNNTEGVDCKFSAKDGNGNNWWTHSNIGSYSNVYGSVDVIADITNAFINGTNFSQSFDYSVIPSYIVSANFTQKASGTKFLCYVGGHFHKDGVIRHQTYTNQVQVLSSCAFPGSPDTDIYEPYIDGFREMPSMTIVAFNNTNMKLHLAKVGSKVANSGYLRDVEIVNILS